MYNSIKNEYSALASGAGRRGHLLKVCVCVQCFTNEDLTECDEDQMKGCEVANHKHRTNVSGPRRVRVHYVTQYNILR